jgi:hypothetical protein
MAPKRERVRLIPRDGARILWPAGTPKQGRALLKTGEEVNLDPYWRARIADGGVRAEPVAESASEGQE